MCMVYGEHHGLALLNVTDSMPDVGVCGNFRFKGVLFRWSM